jgi:predicted metalloprotease with PDZ domain
VTLDDFMRAMWRVHGKPGGAREGEVDHPYTPADAEARLADVTGDPLFAREFFERFIRGRDVPDYARLLAVAGFTVRKHSPGRAWWGDVRLEAQGGRLLVTALVSPTSPAYTAGLEQDDELRQIDGTRVHSPDEVGAIVQRRKPGDVLRITYLDRTEVERTTTVTLTEDPRLDVLPVESAGGRLTTAQRQFRDRWLSAR